MARPIPSLLLEIRTARSKLGGAAAVDAARFLQVRNPDSTITVTDLRAGSNVPFDQPNR